MTSPLPESIVFDVETLDLRRRQYAHIAELLEELYGYPEWRSHLLPLDELVSTILSQSTTDSNRDLAFNRLVNRFPDWEAVRDAPVEDVVEAIRPAGLANQKAPRIQEALRNLTRERGALSLDFLADLEVEAGKAWLTRLNGIGPKTAAIILLFAFNKPAFPVDTHIHRVTGRLGLIGPKASAERAHVELEAIIPPKEYYASHLNLIRHGREVCQARRPRCQECPLTAYCDYFQRIRSGAR